MLWQSLFLSHLLGQVPPVEGEKISLTLIIPPEGHASIQQRFDRIRIPISYFWKCVIQIPATGISRILRRAPATGLAVGQKPTLLIQLLDQFRVPNARFPDSRHMHIVAQAIVCQLIVRLGEKYGIKTEVVVVRLPFTRWIAVVCLVGKPFEVNDDSIQRVFPVTESLQGVLDIDTIRPAPPACDETKGIAWWHGRSAREGIVGLSPCFEGGRWHDIAVPKAGERPVHVLCVTVIFQLIICWISVHIRMLYHTEHGISILGVIVWRIHSRVSNLRIDFGRRQIHPAR
mmetsp:Transcript_16805/g.37171  ORF Transcript_16805/g.37171 Transcript_16805/m.37171 type:complete len:287 (+) Transcript_16805:1265-2125(+)